ncbi:MULTISPECIES: barstar family protein [unclassified Bacillus (in: firmicutes)]|uniref:barstar family protein n=1 Tax=unclassified Bacillus (in: firmicutes) TaxID=185979 RepID=UPI000BF0E11C|nr:barnase inhibitor [Bacillus sp. AFS002410]PEL13098.1 barnase inhibitor [Bacillus sp. AFS017336]
MIIEVYKLTDEIVTIDVSNIKTKKDLHLLLKEKLRFPDFYGENWDAFWDAITGLVAPLPKRVVFLGWSELEKNLLEESEILKECLLEYNEEHEDLPNFISEFIFN